jgi:hypothetical protein
MASFGNLAATYERWAAQDETFAAEILAGLHNDPNDDQDMQTQRAMKLIHKAEVFRKDAANLRFADPRLFASRLYRSS